MTITRHGLERMSKAPGHELGSWFESENQTIFKLFKETKPFTFLRLYDSKSAGNFLPPQPGDFICCSPNDAYLVECKASKKKSLRSCLSSNVSKGQAVDHWMWQRSGHRSMFLFISVPEGTIEIWDGKHVADCRRKGAVLNQSKGLIWESSYEIYQDMLSDIFFQQIGRWDL